MYNKKILVVYMGYNETLHGYFVDNVDKEGYVLFVQEEPTWKKLSEEKEFLNKKIESYKNRIDVLEKLVDKYKPETVVEVFKDVAENKLHKEFQIQFYKNSIFNNKIEQLYYIKWYSIELKGIFEDFCKKNNIKYLSSDDIDNFDKYVKEIKNKEVFLENAKNTKNTEIIQDFDNQESKSFEDSLNFEVPYFANIGLPTYISDDNYSQKVILKNKKYPKSLKSIFDEFKKSRNILVFSENNIKDWEKFFVNLR